MLRDEIEQAIERESLRYYVDSIEDNPATEGEVVLWMGGSGKPVYSVEQALAIVREAAAISE